MSIGNSKKDVFHWKVVDYAGNIMRDSKGKLQTGFDGFYSANAVAKQLGGVAIRV